jgi:prefoldin subunit 5
MSFLSICFSQIEKVAESELKSEIQVLEEKILSLLESKISVLESKINELMSLKETVPVSVPEV